MVYKSIGNKLMEKSQAKTLHISNQGEHLISSKLSRYCIVRDVGQGKDTGIDLYCEILDDETLELTLYFFCQIKTKKRSISLASIKDKYFSYWGNQPAPVFLIVLKYKDENSIQGSHEIWVYDIPYILAKRDAKISGKESPKRDVDHKFRLCEESNNKDMMSLHDFIYRHIPWSYGLWQLRRFGLVLPNPDIKNKDNKYWRVDLRTFTKKKYQSQ
jgi:Domain of unknown function (DUF4365)